MTVSFPNRFDNLSIACIIHVTNSPTIWAYRKWVAAKTMPLSHQIHTAQCHQSYSIVCPATIQIWRHTILCQVHISALGRRRRPVRSPRISMRKAQIHHIPYRIHQCQHQHRRHRPHQRCNNSSNTWATLHQIPMLLRSTIQIYQIQGK